MNDQQRKRDWYVSNRERLLAKAKEYRQRNKEKAYRLTLEWRRNNPEKCREHRRKWAVQNPEKNKLTKTNYEKAHPENRRGASARRRARRLQARPSWLTREQRREIARIYRLCPSGYEVDHIIPLQGSTVSGLHVPWNLQYLPIRVNRAKSNKYEVS